MANNLFISDSKNMNSSGFHLSNAQPIICVDNSRYVALFTMISMKNILIHVHESVLFLEPALNINGKPKSIVVSKRE